MENKFLNMKLEDGTCRKIPIREDGYINATEVCKCANKIFPSWKRTDQTKKIIKLMEKETGLTESQLIQTIQGGTPKLQGTWIHRRLATYLGSWCSPYFYIHISKWVEEWISQNKENEIEYNESIYNLKPDDEDIKEREKLIQNRLYKKFGGCTEVECDCGFIDLLTDTHIIEIKKGNLWKHAVGQILMYGLEFPKHTKSIFLFDIDPDPMINDKCANYNIDVYYWDYLEPILDDNDFHLD